MSVYIRRVFCSKYDDDDSAASAAVAPKIFTSTVLRKYEDFSVF